MEILLMINGTYPSGMAMSKRLHLYAKAMDECGMVPIIHSYSRDKRPQSGFHEGIEFKTWNNPVRFKSYALKQFNSFFASFWFAYIGYKEAKRYKVIYMTGFGWFTALLMIISIQCRNSKTILEVNENPYSPEGGRLDPVWIRRLRRKLMIKLTYAFADGFFVISKPLYDLVNKYKKSNAQVVHIPILTDGKKIFPRRKTCQESPYILHAGALSETKDGIIAVFEAFAIACSRTGTSLRFILTIKTIHPKLRRKLEHIVLANGLKERVVYKDFIPESELEELRNSSTMAIVNKPSNWQNDYNFPTKLGELLSAGVPVIASTTGEMCRYLKDNDSAYLVPANNKEAMAEKILHILNCPGDAERVGENGRLLADSVFNYSLHSEEINAFIKVLINGK